MPRTPDQLTPAERLQLESLEAYLNGAYENLERIRGMLKFYETTIDVHRRCHLCGARGTCAH